MKGNQEPMLYTTNATVAALNHVPGFDPLKFLRRTISRKTGEDVMRLDNHQPMMAYWNGKFYMHFLSDPAEEHVPPIKIPLFSNNL